MDCRRPTLKLLPSLLLLLAPIACGDDSNSDDDIGESSSTGDTDSTDSTGESGSTGETGSTDETGTTGELPAYYEVGFDVADITPDEVEIAEGFYMGGYGVYTARGPAEGVHDPIYARTMALGYGPDDGGIFTIVDTVGFGNEWTRAIRQQAAAATGLSPEQIVIGATHTHSGPDFQGLWGGVPDIYRERVIATIVASMSAAWQARVPARVEVASTTANNRNRRDWGFTDEELVALQAFALDGDAPLGLMVIFAAHPVVLGDDNLLLSRDFCGFTVDALEQDIGAPVLFFNGAQGDVSPSVPDGMYADDFERAQAYGEHIGSRTLEVLAAAEPLEVRLHHDYREFVLDVQNQNFLFAAQAGILDYEFDPQGNETTVTTQTAYFRLGSNQLQMIVFPGESLTRNGLAIKEVMSAPHQAILGLSGDALGYFVPSDEWMTGHNDNYEESVSLGVAAGDTTRDLIIEILGADPWPG